VRRFYAPAREHGIAESVIVDDLAGALIADDVGIDRRLCRRGAVHFAPNDSPLALTPYTATCT
jgi:hypothetical protein